MVYRLTLGLFSSFTRIPEICAVYKAAKSRAVSHGQGGFHDWLVKHKPFIGTMHEVLTFPLTLKSIAI